MNHSNPIVITSDAKAQKVTGAVFRVRVDSSDNWWPLTGNVKVGRPADNPRVLPTDVLVPTRNAKGKFAASLLTSVPAGPDQVAMAGIRLSGSLTSTKAKGTISGWVTVTDTTTMQVVGNYENWKISGRVTSAAATGSVAMKISGAQTSGEAYSFTMPATKFTAKTG